MVSAGAGSGLLLLGTGILGWALASFVGFTAPPRRRNALLIAFLALRGAYHVSFGALSVNNWGLAWADGPMIDGLGRAAVLLDGASAVAFALLIGALLPGKRTRLLRHRAALPVLASAFALFAGTWLAWPHVYGSRAWAFGFYLAGAASLLAFLQAVRSLRKADDAAERIRVRSFLLAFGIQSAYFLVLLSQALAEDGLGLVLPLGPIAWYTSFNYDLWIEAVVAVVFVLTLSYAALTGQLVSLDQRIQRGIQRAVVTTLVAAVFLVLTEGAEGLFGFESALLSILAAGVITMAFQPIQSGAERLAAKLVPGASLAHKLPKRERLRLYEDQVRLAWQDGHLQEKERTMLDRLRTHLELDPKPCEEIEAKWRASTAES